MSKKSWLIGFFGMVLVMSSYVYAKTYATLHDLAAACAADAKVLRLKKALDAATLELKKIIDAANVAVFCTNDEGLKKWNALSNQIMPNSKKRESILRAYLNARSVFYDANQCEGEGNDL